jgi:hypothetical protein
MTTYRVGVFFQAKAGVNLQALIRPFVKRDTRPFAVIAKTNIRHAVLINWRSVA